MYVVDKPICQTSPHVITFFIRPLPTGMKPAEDAKKIADQINTPGRMLKSVVKKALSPVLFYSGIYAAYAGNFTHSTTDGQVIFERSTPDPALYVLVTEDMKVVPVNPLNDKTIYGFAIDPKAQSGAVFIQAHSGSRD